MGGDCQNISEKTFGSLGACLVEGDPEQRARERRVRRRALAISVALQGAALAALVLVPLFGKSERIVLANVTPVPPYYHPKTPAQPNIRTEHLQPITTFNLCVSCPVPSPHPHSPTRADDVPQPPGVYVSGEGQISNFFCPACIPMAGQVGPTPPQTETIAPPPRVSKPHIDPALLIHRVEPVYPPLPRQMGRGGRVELRAIVATDGTIQSLQIVSGDPLFIQSALDAVRQWRYRPTFLNGQPVEIDTFITVTYYINR
jgi:periplasmic protein TonB